MEVTKEILDAHIRDLEASLVQTNASANQIAGALDYAKQLRALMDKDESTPEQETEKE